MSTPRPPLIQLWFGNFFEPWLSDRQRVSVALAEIRDLGFTSVSLDSKPWEDFYARAAGGPPSAYVAMQEFMLAEAHRLGLGHAFLALYLNGDNLYPDLRDAPPRRGEDAIGIEGRSLDTYKYWSPVAQDTMVEHVAGLLRMYRDGHADLGGDGPALPLHSMFDPIVKPSFDAEGRARYLGWLEQRYAGDLEAFNRRYGLQATSFVDLAPADYWLRPEELHYCTCAYPAHGDFRDRTPVLHRWVDNQTWLESETEQFFKTMQQRLRALDPRLFLMPVLAQWGMFFCAPGNRWWDIATRAIDPYRLAPFVDSALFIAAALNPEDDADPYALSAELSIMRNANAGREFIAGLFLGRHVHRDLNRSVAPAEAIGLAALHGAAGLQVYGYGGADDGGVIQHLAASDKESLALGNHWATRVLPQLAGQQRRPEAAILFPRATHLLEPMLSEEGRQHRLDLLGWHRLLTDRGFNVDIIHPDQLLAGGASAHRILILPADPCQELAPIAGLEEALAAWVSAGGLCVHGPGSLLAQAALGVVAQPHPVDCIDLGGRLLIPDGWATCAYPQAECLAGYRRSGSTALGLTRLGSGRTISVGFHYGFSYATKRRPVPHGYHREEAFGVQLIDANPLVAALDAIRPQRWNPGRGVEAAWFDQSLVLVNHRTTPVRLPPQFIGTADWQIEAGGLLLAHAAVQVRLHRQSVD